jgi:YfiH family protein
MDESITPPTTDLTRAMFERSRLPADWPAPSRVHAFTTLRGPAGGSVAPFDSFNLGMRCGDDLAVVMRNRDALVEHLRLPSPPRWLQQTHGVVVATCDDATCAGEPEADAAVTSSPGVVLAILTADCMPVLFSSEDGSTNGAAHAGWRGLAAGILESTVAAMRMPAERILAWLGAAAGPLAYEVGDEVRAAFVDADPDASSAFAMTRPGHWFCDLYALARLRLASVGVTRVYGGNLCTMSDPQRFFSHRRDGRTGRMASLIWINRVPEVA